MVYFEGLTGMPQAPQQVSTVTIFEIAGLETVNVMNEYFVKIFGKVSYE
jgi:hypothetical protein